MDRCGPGFLFRNQAGLLPRCRPGRVILQVLSDFAPQSHVRWSVHWISTAQDQDRAYADTIRGGLSPMRSNLGALSASPSRSNGLRGNQWMIFPKPTSGPASLRVHPVHNFRFARYSPPSHTHVCETGPCTAGAPGTGLLKLPGPDSAGAGITPLFGDGNGVAVRYCSPAIWSCGLSPMP